VTHSIVLIQAERTALATPGSELADIDGVASYPGPVAAEGGFVGATTHEVRDALGLRTTWALSGVETPGQAGTLMDAASAIATGKRMLLTNSPSAISFCTNELPRRRAVLARRPEI